MDFGMPRALATMRRQWNRIWVELITFRRPVRGSMLQYVRKVSIMACCTAFVWKVCSTTTSHSERTRSTSPWPLLSEATRFRRLSPPQGIWAFQLSSGWTRISASFALCMSRTGVRTWYFTFISFSARSTHFSSAPATIAAISPA